MHVLEFFFGILNFATKQGVGVVESDLQALAVNKGPSQQEQSSEQKEKSHHF